MSLIFSLIGKFKNLRKLYQRYYIDLKLKMLTIKKNSYLNTPMFYL